MIAQETEQFLREKVREIDTRVEFRNVVSEYCTEKGLDYWDVWQGCARPLFMLEQERRLRNAAIEAVKNTFEYFPSFDLKRVENWDTDDVEQNITIDKCDEKLVVKKIFGIEVKVENPKCRCFALRWREPDGWPTLLTTFDFVSYNDKNMVWGAGFKTRDDKYIPTVLYYSLEDFIKTYIAFTDEEFDANKLVIVDDTP